jgi:arylsulfatase A-like enzyme
MGSDRSAVGGQKVNFNRRDFLRLTGLGIAASAIGIGCRSMRGDRPNIVLCMADDQGWGDMGYNGHPVLSTPNFDALASEALRFDRFYAAAPVCSPTRGSVLTGRHPNRYGCFSWGRTLRPQEITLAEALKSAGYATGHFGKWHVGSVQSGSPVNPKASGFDEWVSAPNFFDNDPVMSRQGRATQMTGESSMVTAEAAIEFIQAQAKSSQPFLALVWFGSPHLPHQAVERDRILYEDQEEELQHFYGEISGLDRAFGHLRTALRDFGISDSTILWYCSDNGGLPNVGSTGGRGHKGQIYEGGLRVPALLEWPARLDEQRTTNVPAVTSDVYPTLLEVAGVAMEHQPPLDGISLVPLIDGTMEDRPQPIGFWHYPGGGIATPSAVWMAELLEAQQADPAAVPDSFRLRLDAGDLSRQYPEGVFLGHAAWLDWPWKLHRIEDNEGSVNFELYNLESDPAEANDASELQRDRVTSMTGDLEAWQTSVISSLNGRDYR